MKNIKTDFPIFAAHPDLVYLDSAATSQKPQAVIDAVTKFYAQANSNIHRGIYDLSQEATGLFESVRSKTADFINAHADSEIIFTSGTTEAINFVANGWGRKHLKPGDIIVTTVLEHHSNFVPWLQLQKDIGIKLIVLPLDENYRVDYSNTAIDYKRVKLLAFSHASNVLGTVVPIKEIAEYFRGKGANAKLLVDAAQIVPHLSVDVRDLDADFLVFSAHKMLGPTGVGVLYAKKELLEQMDPLLVGSHMIETVTTDDYTLANIPDRFEPGTRNIEGVIGLGAAIDYLQTIGFAQIEAHENQLSSYALEQLGKIPGLKLYGPTDSTDRLAIFSFSLGNVHSHDLSEILNRSHIAVRAGHHCAGPLMQALGVPGTTRASAYLYNTKDDIDQLIAGIQKAKEVFHV